MQQYNAIKAKYPDAVLLFRVGDFYETFGQDAIKAARILGIVLTNRANGSSKIELAGFPHHSLDTYLPKLVRSGCRVAICDQLEDMSDSRHTNPSQTYIKICNEFKAEPPGKKWDGIYTFKQK